MVSTGNFSKPGLRKHRRSSCFSILRIPASIIRSQWIIEFVKASRTALCCGVSSTRCRISMRNGLGKSKVIFGNTMLLSNSAFTFISCWYVTFIGKNGFITHLCVAPFSSFRVHLPTSFDLILQSSDFFIYLHQFHIQFHIWRKTHKNRLIHAYLLKMLNDPLTQFFATVPVIHNPDTSSIS